MDEGNTTKGGKVKKKTVPSAKEKDVIIVMTKVITLKQRKTILIWKQILRSVRRIMRKARKDLMKGPQMKNPTLNLRRMLMSVKKKFQKKAQKKSQKLKPSCPLDSINMH